MSLVFEFSLYMDQLIIDGGGGIAFCSFLPPNCILSFADRASFECEFLSETWNPNEKKSARNNY